MTNDLQLKKIRQKVKKAIYDYGLIDDGDKILVGLSGGKDSLALTELLAAQQRIAVPRFSIVVAHVSLENVPYESDVDYLRDFCQQHGAEFLHIKTSFAPANDAKKDEKTPCFFCSWSRRKALFVAAKQLNCNKIALGHHQDDILETFLMNMTFQSNLSTMPPKLTMDKFAMTLIRPLCLLSEADLQAMSTIRGYKKQLKNCPYEKTSQRTAMRQLLAQLETLNPHARQNLWSALHNPLPDYLPRKEK